MPVRHRPSGPSLSNIALTNSGGSVGDKVPAWTPEDEEVFGRRLHDQMFHVVGWDPDTKPLPPTQLSFTATLGIAKRHRATCPSCRMRRVLFSIVATGNLFGGSEARCARCWGLR